MNAASRILPWAVAATLLAAPACAPKLMRLPSPGAPATDGAQALDQATRQCRDVRVLTAEVGVSGRAGGQKVRGRLAVGLEAPASARIEAVAPFGAPAFIFVATAGDATLLLPRDARVLEHGRPTAVLETIAGVPLDPADLRAVVTGCPATPAEPAQTRSGGRDWRLVASADEVLYLHKDPQSGPWRIVATTHSGERAWRVEYRDFQGDLARNIHFQTRSLAEGGTDLTFALSQVDVNTTLEADAFRVQIPKGTEPITLDELRRSGPLAERQRR